MTFTITGYQFYIGIVVAIVIVQGYQQTQIRKLQKDKEQLWEQISTFISSLAIQIVQLQEEIKSKKDKE
jgi:hypothetical protein